MISHVVLFRPKAGLPADDRRALVVALERAVREIPSVRGVRVGRRLFHGAGYEQMVQYAADYLIVIDFENLAGLQTYLRHPAHEELGELFNQSLSSALIYDFDAGGIDKLQELL